MQAASQAVALATRALRAQRFDSIGILASSPTGLLPLRLGYEWQPDGQVRKGCLSLCLCLCLSLCFVCQLGC